MNHARKIIPCFLFALACGPALRAGSATNAQLPTITVNGVMVMDGNRKVLFKVADANNGSAGFVLGEGEGGYGIKVVAIDGLSGAVTFDNHGTLQKITAQRTPPMNTYVPPAPAPAPVAAAPAPIPTPQPAYTEPASGGAGLVVIGSRRNNSPTGFRHITGLTPQNIGNGPNNFAVGSPPAPGKAGAANQPVQAAPAPIPIQSAPPQPNGPQFISVGAGMEMAGSRPDAVQPQILH